MEVFDARGGVGTTTVLVTAQNPNRVPPLPPSNLSVSDVFANQASLRWTDNSSNEQGFAIERAPSGSSSYVQVGQVSANATSYTETVAKATYLYRVRAYNTSTGKFSAYSNVITVRVTK